MKNNLKTVLAAGLIAVVLFVGTNLAIKTKNDNSTKKAVVESSMSEVVVAGSEIKLATPEVANVENSTKKVIKNVVIGDAEASRVLYLVGPVFDNALDLADEIQYLNRLSSTKPIYLLIFSPGGSVLAGETLISAIEASRAPVYTVCQILCASMAAMIHQYGTQRWQVDRSLLMFHPATGGAQGEVDKMYSFIGSLKNHIDKLDRSVAVRAGMSYDKFKAMTSVELWIDAEDATRMKLNDKIVNISLPTDLMVPLEAGEEGRVRTYGKFGQRDLIWIQPGYNLTYGGWLDGSRVLPTNVK